MPTCFAMQVTSDVTIFKDKLTILSFNARRLRNKIDEVRCLVLTEIFYVIVIVTFTSQTYLFSERYTDSYSLLNKDRINR